MKKTNNKPFFFFPTGLLKFEKYIENVIPLFFYEDSICKCTTHTHEKSENKEQIWKDQIHTTDGSGHTQNFY